MPQVLEIDQSSLRGNYADLGGQSSSHALGEDYEQAIRRQAGNGPGQNARRKHQIGSLYHDAKMVEAELLRNKTKAVKTKRETQAKYGW
jgi:proline-rich protein PRCC